MSQNALLLTPDWPVPCNVHAVCSTRQGGYSAGPYASLNLGEHVADDQALVFINRRHLQQQAAMPGAPVWLQQVHGTQVQMLKRDTPDGLTGDASVTTESGVVCTVMTADCLPLLLCNRQGTQVAAVHAGWRGLCDGVIEATIAHFAEPDEVLAYLGPAISQQSFEVGSEVRAAFIACATEAERAFRPGANGKWQADLYMLARQRLSKCGVQHIYGGSYCTYLQPELFFSYRRDGQTGRMASCIWID